MSEDDAILLATTQRPTIRPVIDVLAPGEIGETVTVGPSARPQRVGGPRLLHPADMERYPIIRKIEIHCAATAANESAAAAWPLRRRVLDAPER